MLTHHGLPISEPLAFGLANALSFAYLPFIKLAGLPLVSYRMPPGDILRGLQRNIGVRTRIERFRTPAQGTRRLDQLLAEGRLVGLQASVFWLPYFPAEMRFHFNAHNLLIYGRNGDQYHVSDPVFEAPHTCDQADMEKARFAKGALSSRGMLYYPTQVPATVDYKRAVRKALKANLRIMTGAPVPVIGIRGIRYLGRNIRARERKGEDRTLRLYLAHIIRMQEEIGTGGAGFRFLYASFLQEVGALLANDLLLEASTRMTEAGDSWREFALQASKMSKDRLAMDTQRLNDILNQCADQEQAVWKLLKQVLASPLSGA